MDLVFDIIKVFLYAMILDIIYVFWFLNVIKKNKLLAASLSMFMAAPAINGFLEIVDNRILQIPYLIGLGTGTVIGISLDDYIQKNKKCIIKEKGDGNKKS